MSTSTKSIVLVLLVAVAGFMLWSSKRGQGAAAVAARTASPAPSYTGAPQVAAQQAVIQAQKTNAFDVLLAGIKSAPDFIRAYSARSQGNAGVG